MVDGDRPILARREHWLSLGASAYELCNRQTAMMGCLGPPSFAFHASIRCSGPPAQNCPAPTATRS